MLLEVSGRGRKVVLAGGKRAEVWLKAPEELERMERLGLSQRSSVLPRTGPLALEQRDWWQCRGPS